MARSIKGNAGHKNEGNCRQILKDRPYRLGNAIDPYPQILLAAINARHDGSRADVSVPLSSAEEESAAFIGAFEILDLEDGASRYRIALKKK